MMKRNVNTVTFGAFSADSAHEVARACLKRAPGFAQCPDRVLGLLLNAGKARTYGMGEYCVHFGDPETHLGLVIQGKLDTSVIRSDGRRQLLGMLIPGDLYGIMNLTDPQPSTVTLTAREPSQVVLFPYADVRKLRLKHPELVVAFEGQVVSRCRLLFSRIGIDGADRSEPRLAKTLGILLKVYGQSSASTDEIRVNFSQVDLADFAGLSRPIVNRVLRKFEKKGLLRLGYSHLTVLDRQGLATLEAA